AERRAAALEKDRRFAGERALELVEQARLPRAGVADHRHDLRAIAEPAEGLVEPGELRGPADERREAALRRDGHRRDELAAPDDLVPGDAVSLAADAERGAHRALRRILVRQRRTEERHQPVAREVGDDTLELVDLATYDLEVAVEQLRVVLGIEARGDRRGSDEVAEEHRHLLTLTRDGTPRGADLVGQTRRNVTRQPRDRVAGWRRHGVVHALVLLQAAVGTEAEAGVDGRTAAATLHRHGRSTRVAESFSG